MQFDNDASVLEWHRATYVVRYMDFNFLKSGSLDTHVMNVRERISDDVIRFTGHGNRSYQRDVLISDQLWLNNVAVYEERPQSSVHISDERGEKGLIFQLKRNIARILGNVACVGERAGPIPETKDLSQILGDV